MPSAPAPEELAPYTNAPNSQVFPLMIAREKKRKQTSFFVRNQNFDGRTQPWLVYRGTGDSITDCESDRLGEIIDCSMKATLRSSKQVYLCLSSGAGALYHQSLFVPAMPFLSQETLHASTCTYKWAYQTGGNRFAKPGSQAQKKASGV